MADQDAKNGSNQRGAGETLANILTVIVTVLSGVIARGLTLYALDSDFLRTIRDNPLIRLLSYLVLVIIIFLAIRKGLLKDVWKGVFESLKSTGMKIFLSLMLMLAIILLYAAILYRIL